MIKHDIVTLLRTADGFDLVSETMNEAADEIERLREALRPFAERAAAYDQNESSEPAWWHTERPTVGDLRRARAALWEKEK